MARIADIEISHHTLPLDPPFPAAWDTKPRTTAPATIVRVRDTDGRQGVGSGDLMLGFAGHEGLFIGQDPRDLARHGRVIDNLSFHYGRCWPLELALWDLAGQQTGQPVWRMLGGLSDRVLLYASTGVLRAPEAMADQLLALADQGFPAAKLRFHRASIYDDLDALEAVKVRVDSDIALMVDCNQAWRMPWDTESPWPLKTALSVARALEALDVIWMEEPLHRSDLKGLQALRAQVDIPIAGGEMARERHDLQAMIDARAVDILQPDVTLVGGIGGLADIAKAAIAAGLQFTPHTWGNGIGLVANAHLAAGIADSPFLEFPYDPPEWSIARRDFMLTQPIEPPEDGVWVLPDVPGLGLLLDEDRLKATRA